MSKRLNGSRDNAVAPAFDAALRSGKTTLLELRVDPNLIVPRATIADVRALARSPVATA